MTIPDKCIFVRIARDAYLNNRHLRFKINDRTIYNYETKMKENVINLSMLSIGSDYKRVRVK